MTLLANTHGSFGLAVAAALMVATSAAAQDWTDNYYVGLRAIGSVAELGDTSTNGFTGPALVEHDSDEVAGIAGMIG